MAAVEGFNIRIRELLDTPSATDTLGGLSPPVRGLFPPAHAASVQALAGGGSSTTTATITPAPLQVMGVTAQQRAYDTTLAVVLGGTASRASIGVPRAR